MQSIEEQILNKINNYNRGKIFFPDDFAAFGSSEAVRQALVRLKEEGELVRLAHGIYLYPKTDSQLGVLKPTVEKIAEAIAKRDKAKIIPSGALALNKLGLSTQVPMNAVYLTDGSQRSIQIGNRKIKFKRTVPKNLKAKGEISSLVIQALKEIGKGNVTEQQKEKITELLKKEKSEHLKYDIKLAPVWIREIMERSIEK
jgi:predicted transcriptional regulator of viral defense system